MNWVKETRIKLTHREIAEQVLQIYTKSLQDHKSLKSILSECCVLDYFGKLFYGQEKVASHLISNLHGSSYELSSLSINDQPSVIQWNSVINAQKKVDDDLGVTVISPPKCTFPNITFTTPVRSFSQPKKRTPSEASLEDCDTHSKMYKLENNAEQSSSNEKRDDDKHDMLLSPQSIQTISQFLKDVRYLTACGTIQYPNRVFPTMDLKKIKQHNLVALRGRFCQLYIGYECDENAISVTNCKIRTIKYSFCSKVTPRNLLKAFNEVDMS